MVTEEPIYEPLKHSGYGIASFILALVIAFIEFFLVIVGCILEAIFPSVFGEDKPGEIIIGFAVLGGCIMLLAGLGLALAGLLQQNSSKVFPVLGLIFNAAFLIGAVVMIILGVLLV